MPHTYLDFPGEERMRNQDRPDVQELKFFKSNQNTQEAVIAQVRSSCLKVCLYRAVRRHADMPMASQKSQLGQSHASISSEHGAPLSPKGERRLMFRHCILSCLQEADNAALLCRSVDVTDTYRHVHPLWSESIMQPQIWVRYSDSTCNSV